MKLVFSHFILLNLNSSFFLLQKKKKRNQIKSKNRNLYSTTHIKVSLKQRAE